MSSVADDVRKLAADYAQRAVYVQQSNPRMASVWSTIAKQLRNILAAHTAAKDKQMEGQE